MKRNPRKLGWTKAFRRAHGKEMTVDSTLAFAARRNIPVRYNRDLVENTVKAMERIEEIKAKRQRVFYKKRMEGNKARQRLEDAKLVAENEHLLPRMRGSEKKALEMNVDENVLRLEEEATIETTQKPIKTRQKVKKKLLVGGGVEEVMDIE